MWVSIDTVITAFSSTSTWQARSRGEPGIQACLLKTQGRLRSFPKHKPSNKVDKEILK